VHSITVMVRDNGSPPLSDVQYFTLAVLADALPKPDFESITVSGTTVNLIWRAIPGKSYHLHFKNNLNDIAWNDLPGDVTATDEIAIKTDNPGKDMPQRFYRVELLP
jgi:hypothetical protein